jgi:DNA-binding transcriptional regulator YhcF (GntR family)
VTAAPAPAPAPEQVPTLRAETDDIHDAAWRLVVADVLPSITRLGQRMPSYRALATKHGVSIAPVRHAYAVLKGAGILEGQPGRGVYVARIPGPDDVFGPTVARRVDILQRQVTALSDDLAGLRAIVEGLVR